MLSLHDCFRLARKECPCHIPYSFYEYGHYCFIHLCPKWYLAKIVQPEYRRIDRFTGKLSAHINVQDMMQEPEFGIYLSYGDLVSDYLRAHPERPGGRSLPGRLRSRLRNLLSGM